MTTADTISAKVTYAVDVLATPWTTVRWTTVSRDDALEFARILRAEGRVCEVKRVAVTTTVRTTEEIDNEESQES